MPNTSSLQDFLLAVIQEAGTILERYFSSPYPIRRKDNTSNALVTQADLASERFIIQKIKHFHPNDAILSEESGYHNRHSDSGMTWIVDPLDGTWNYVHGIRNCGVMIARADRQDIFDAVVYNPFKKVTVQAGRGAGVLVNHCPFKVTMKEDFVGPYIIDEGPLEKVFAPLQVGYYCLRSAVDNALQLLLGAAGAYFNISAKVWDLAPVSLIFVEAGFSIINAFGQPYQWREEKGLVAVPPRELAKFRALLAERLSDNSKYRSATRTTS